MVFYSPLAFIGLVTIPFIIILYLLKQKYQERRIASLYLWQQVLKDMEANAPWQKLRKNILMILQILAMILFTLALAKPFVNISNSSDRVIILMDTSLSMKATDISPNRMEYAKQQADQYVNNIYPGTSVTIVSMGDDAIIKKNLSKDKNSIKETIKKMKASNSTIDKDAAVSLVQSVARGYPNTRVVHFGDSEIKIPGIETIFHRTCGDGTNYAVTLISNSQFGNGITALTRIKNYDDKTVEIPVTLYVDEKVFDSKNINIKANKTADIYWKNIPLNAKFMECRIEKKDSLSEDNRAWDVVNTLETNRVILISAGNTFIEKALSLMNGVKVYKAGLENADKLKNFDLYIYDGFLPDTLPPDGNIMVFNPPENKHFMLLNETERPAVKQSEHKLFEYVDDYAFSIGKTKILKVPHWGETVLDSEEGTVIFSGVKENIRIVVLGFDIHNTDIPLKQVFPVLMSNAVDWLVPSGINNIRNIIPGDRVTFNLNPRARNAKVITPSQESFEIAPPFPALAFNRTDEIGRYTLVQYLPEGNESNYFMVNAPTKQESNLYADYKEAEFKEDISGEKQKKANSGYNLTRIILWILLCLLAIEWWVYINGI